MSLFLSVQFLWSQNLDIPQVPAPTQVSQEVLLWSASGKFSFGKDKKHDVNLGLATTFSGLGSNFESMNYVVSFRSKVTNNIRLSTLYTVSKISKAGWSNSILLGPQFEFDKVFFKPSIRLSYNYVWFGGGQDPGIARPNDDHRIRIRFMGRHKITKDEKIQLILLAEPFLYKMNEGFLKEVRTNVGLYFFVNKNIALIPLYGFNWSRNDVANIYRHTIGAHMSVTFTK